MLYIKTKTKPTSIEELYKTWFSYETEPGQQLRGRATYYDEKCTDEQCESNKVRSFEDISEVITTYFPYATNDDVIHVILTCELLTKDKHLLPYFTTCSSIERINILYYHELNREATTFDGTKYESEYSWKELLATKNIKTNKDIIKYINKYKIKEEVGCLETAPLNL